MSLGTYVHVGAERVSVCSLVFFCFLQWADVNCNFHQLYQDRMTVRWKKDDDRDEEE